MTEPEHTIDVLLLHPKSDAFINRAEEEEKKRITGKNSSRIEKEWVASIAILRDIAIQSRKSGEKAVEQRLKIRLHKAKPDRSLLLVATPEVIPASQSQYSPVPVAPASGARQAAGVKSGRTETQDNSDSKNLGKYLLLNIYPISPKLSGQSSVSLLVTDEWVEYTENLAYFDCLWCCEHTVQMDVKKLIAYKDFSNFVIKKHLGPLLTQGTGGNLPFQENLVECRKKLREAEMDLYPEEGQDSNKDQQYSDEFPRCICDEPSGFLRMDYTKETSEK